MAQTKEPTCNRQTRSTSNKIKQAKMRSQPENLHWDYIFSKSDTDTPSVPCDVQFFTKRADQWKTECMTYYGDERNQAVVLKPINSGEQLVVDGHIFMNFYNTGTVLVQGRNFVTWGEQEFHVLQLRLDEIDHSSLSPPAVVGLPKLKPLTDQSAPRMSTPNRPLPDIPNMAHMQDDTVDILLMDSTINIIPDTDISDASEDSTSMVEETMDVSEHSVMPDNTKEASVNVNHLGNVEQPKFNMDTSLDSLLTGTKVFAKRLTDLDETRRSQEEQLMKEKEKAVQLQRDTKLMKQTIAIKDSEIRQLEKKLATIEQKQHKQQKVLSKSQKMNEQHRKSDFVERRQRGEMDNENTQLREENRELRKRVDHLADQLNVMTAKCDSLQGSTSELPNVWGPPLPAPVRVNRPKKTEHVLTSPWIPLHPELVSEHAGARPKEPVPGPKPLRPLSKVLAPRMQPPQALAEEQPSTANTPQHTNAQQPPRKIKATVIGASNTRHLAPQLQNQDVDSVVYFYPGHQLHHRQESIATCITKDTDVAVLHFGTNDVLNADSNNTCLINADNALDFIDKTQHDTRPDVPILVCEVPPIKSPSSEIQWRLRNINALFRWKCARSQHLHFVETGLSIHDLGRDGIHLNRSGQNKVCTTILAKVQDFRKDTPHKDM